MLVFRFFPLALLAVCAFVGCNTRVPRHSVAFDQISFVENTPATKLDAGEIVPVDAIGAIDIELLDSFLIVSTEGRETLLHFYREEDYLNAGELFRLGNGPYEVTSLITLTDMSVFSENGHTVIGLYDNDHFYAVNLSASLSAGQVICDWSEEAPASLKTMRYVKRGEFLCRRWIGESRMQRFLYSSVEERPLVVTGPLDQSVSPGPEGMNFNILNSLLGYDVSRQRVVEASMRMNTIHIYNLDGSFRRTICLGNRVTDISKIEHSSFWEIPACFVDLRTSPEGFSCLFQHRDVLAFDWEGNLLSRWALPEEVDCFALDYAAGKLYTLSYEKEEIRKYRIPQID